MHKSGRQLIVVHLRGSHFDYAKRYPIDFAAFKPDADCDERNCTINAYDNSILFTDYLLSRFIEDIKGREALLFYMADHGASLGETDQRGQVYWKHGQNGGSSNAWFPCRFGHPIALSLNTQASSQRLRVVQPLL